MAYTIKDHMSTTGQRLARLYERSSPRWWH